LQYFLLTFDIEDWFQVENFKTCIPFSSWSSRESRVERNTHVILDFLDLAGSKNSNDRQTKGPLRATFFVLGWVAQRIPGLVRQIHARGHEVASHGYNHNLCNRCSTEELKEDLEDSKKLLENILGAPVLGYRAPSFSITEETLEILEDCGYQYDSSFNSFATNDRYGKIETFSNGTGIVCKTRRKIYELPISNFSAGRYTFPIGGGAYFRLMPVRLFTKMAKSVIRSKNAFLFYLHPWEADPGQPRVRDAHAFLRFRHYVNISSTLSKLHCVINSMKDLSFVSCGEYVRQVVK
jgi:polysaccharide deacetylase family protein (PEP-CTERM system associated)